MEDKKYLVLYRKWRPQTFDEVCGQEHITSVLKYETANNHLSHAYLFCGSRGTGKTTCARILAKAVNCLDPHDGNPCGTCAACRAVDSGTATDILEMDAASNNGVDNIRDIRDEVNYAPSDLKYRVYIIDEVHMLSPSAFNALLKTLEEPPEHVIFILATTELQKLPATIISRCQRFDFRRIATPALVSRLNHIAGGEGIELDPDAAHLLARLSQGGMRDAITLLELCAGGHGRVTVDAVNEAVGSVGREAVIKTAAAVAKADYDAIFGVIADIVGSSKDLMVFWQELLLLYRDLLVIRTTPDASKYLDLTDSETARLTETARLFNRETLLAHCRLLDSALVSMQRSNAVKRTVAELTLIRMSDAALDTSNESLLARIANLEDAVSRGAVAVPDTAQTVAGSVHSSAPTDAENESMSESIDIKDKTFAVQPPASAPKAKDAGSPVPEKTDKLPAQGKRVLKALRCWAEVTERVARSRQALSALLAGSRAYTDPDEKVVLMLASEFSLSMIERSGAKDTIKDALSAGLKRPLRDGDVIYEVTPKQGDPAVDNTVFDELEAVNEQ